MAFFASSGRRPVSDRCVGLIGMAVVLITITAAALTVWDLRQQAIRSYQQEMRNLGVAFAEQFHYIGPAASTIEEEIRRLTVPLR